MKQELIKNNLNQNMLQLDAKTEKQILGMLENEAKYLLKTKFEKELNLNIPIEINGRLTRTLGAFYHNNYRALKIGISKKQVIGAVIDGNIEPILDTLRHEVVHYAMYTLKKGYNDGDKDFEDALAKIGVSSSGTTSKRKINSQKELIWYSMKDDYVCPNCQGECKVQHKKSTTTYYRCPKCMVRLKKQGYLFIEIKVKDSQKMIKNFTHYRLTSD